MQGNLIRNLVPKRPAGTDPSDSAGIGIGVEADTAVTGNTIENAPNRPHRGRLGTIPARRQRDRRRGAQRGVGISVSVSPGAGSA